MARPSRRISIRVFQKENGSWRIRAFHNTTIAATLKQDSYPKSPFRAGDDTRK